MKATKHQKQYIYKLSGYRQETKEEWVQWATDDVTKTSTHDLTFAQANAIIKQAGCTPVTSKGKTDNWAFFDNNNSKHRYILSLCRQLDWQVADEKYGKIVNLNRLSEWLKSKRSPVNKPLQKQTPGQLSKTITALEGIIKSEYRK